MRIPYSYTDKRCVFISSKLRYQMLRDTLPVRAVRVSAGKTSLLYLPSQQVCLSRHTEQISSSLPQK